MPLLPGLLDEVLERIYRRRESGAPMGLTTGITRLDELLGEGWERQQLTYLVGDSGIGKSWLALWFVMQGAKWLAENAPGRPHSDYFITSDIERHIKERVQNKESKLPLVVFWSLEMAQFMVMIRMVSMATWMLTNKKLDSARLKLGKLDANESLNLVEGYNALHDKWGQHIFLEFDTPTIYEFQVVLNELAESYDIVLIVVDYFRRIEEFQGDGAAQIQAARSSGLRDMAKLYDCHVMSIFDINRIGQRSKTVQLGHMKDGTAAQYDADNVLIMNDQQGKEEGFYDTVGRIWLQVAKNRFGETGNIELSVDRSVGSFKDVREENEGLQI